MKLQIKIQTKQTIAITSLNKIIDKKIKKLIIYTGNTLLKHINDKYGNINIDYKTLKNLKYFNLAININKK